MAQITYCRVNRCVRRVSEFGTAGQTKQVGHLLAGERQIGTLKRARPAPETRRATANQ